MEINMPDDVLQSSIQSAVSDAIKGGLNDWQIKKQLQEALTENIKGLDLPARVSVELNRILPDQVDALVKDAAQDMIPAVKTALAEAMKHTMTQMIYGLISGMPSSYDNEGKKAWNEAVKIASGKTTA